MTDPTTTLPLDLVPLREEAERLAKELLGLVRSHTWYETHHDAFLVQLADLTRPASRDFWVRWAGENDKRWKVVMAKTSGNFYVRHPWGHRCTAAHPTRGTPEHWIPGLIQSYWNTWRDSPASLKGHICALVRT